MIWRKGTRWRPWLIAVANHCKQRENKLVVSIIWHGEREWGIRKNISRTLNVKQFISIYKLQSIFLCPALILGYRINVACNLRIIYPRFFHHEPKIFFCIIAWWKRLHWNNRSNQGDHNDAKVAVTLIWTGTHTVACFFQYLWAWRSIYRNESIGNGVLIGIVE